MLYIHRKSAALAMFPLERLASPLFTALAGGQPRFSCYSPSLSKDGAFIPTSRVGMKFYDPHLARTKALLSPVFRSLTTVWEIPPKRGWVNHTTLRLMA